MKSFLYDESETATIIYNNGFTNGYDKRELLLYAKYLRHVLGYKDVKIKKKLIEFCSKDSSFNEVIERKHIKFCVKNSKVKLFTRTSILITREEINRAKKLKNFVAQKVYLSLLLIAKRNRYNSVSIKLFTEIKRISGVNCTTIELGSILHLLYKAKLIYPTANEKNNFIDGYNKILDIDFEGEAEISINSDRDLFNFSKIYEKYCGGYLIYCEVCKKEMIRKGSAHKLCEEHFLEKEKFRKRSARI